MGRVVVSEEVVEATVTAVAQGFRGEVVGSIHPDDREDVLQELRLRMLQAFPNWDPAKGDLHGYLRTVCFQELKGLRRGRGRVGGRMNLRPKHYPVGQSFHVDSLDPLEEEAPGVAGLGDNVEDWISQETVAAFLQSLPESVRITVLRKLAGTSARAQAVERGCSRAAVYKQIGMARKAWQEAAYGAV